MKAIKFFQKEHSFEIVPNLKNIQILQKCTSQIFAIRGQGDTRHYSFSFDCVDDFFGFKGNELDFEICA